MLKHVRKFHSEEAKRRASVNDELERLELLHADKVPRLSVEHQTGGAVSTRGTKRVADDGSPDVKDAKNDQEDEPEKSDTSDDGTGPLFQAKIDKMGKPKSWKKGKVIDQKFTFTLDQRREANPDEDLGVEAVHALVTGMDNLMDDINIDKYKYDLAFQIGSKEHFKETGLTGETWHAPADDYYQRTERTQAMLGHIANVLNSGEFISSDRGFSASTTLIRREVKGGKKSVYKPGEKIWQEVVKEMRCVYEVKNNNELCRGRAIVVMREYAKHKAGEPNCLENVRKNRGKKTQQLKLATELYKVAGVPEGPCGFQAVEQFQNYLGPKGYQAIVVDPVRGGVIFKAEAYKNAPKVIQLVKTYYEDGEDDTKAHYDGLYSVAPIMNRSTFCRYCCKGYDQEDARHHNCLHANCPSCKRRRNEHSQRCIEFTGWSNPTITCKECNRQFYGEDCYQAHLIQTKQEETKMEKDLREQIEIQNDITITPKETFKSVCVLQSRSAT